MNHHSVPIIARPYYGLAVLSATTWKSKGTSIARNLVGYATGILDGIEEARGPICSLNEAFTPAHLVALGLDHLTIEGVREVLRGPNIVNVQRRGGNETAVVVYGPNSERVNIMLYDRAIEMASERLAIPAVDVAIILGAIVGSYSYVWKLRSEVYIPQVGMTIAVKNLNAPGRPVYGTPACVEQPASWHPLFARILAGETRGPFSPAVLEDDDFLNPPFSGHHFARSLDAIAASSKTVQFVVPNGWLQGYDNTAVVADRLIVEDEITPQKIHVTSTQLRSLRLGPQDNIEPILESMKRTIESLKVGWGAHLPWRVPVFILKVSRDVYLRFCRDYERFDDVVPCMSEPSVVCFTGAALIAHSGSPEPYLLSDRSSDRALLLVPPGTTVQPLSGCHAIVVA